MLALRLGPIRAFAVCACLCFVVVPLFPGIVVGVAAACEGGGEEEGEEAGPALSVTDPVEFGLQTVNTESKPMTVTYKARKSVKLAKLEMLDASFKASEVNFKKLNDKCSGTVLLPKGKCTVEVKFLPTAVIMYEYHLSVNFEIKANKKVETLINNLKGTGQ
jgi:hypothetical protein